MNFLKKVFRRQNCRTSITEVGVGQAVSTSIFANNGAKVQHLSLCLDILEQCDMQY